MRRSHGSLVVVLSIALPLAAGCGLMRKGGPAGTRAPGSKIHEATGVALPATDETIEEARAILHRNAKAQRAEWAAKTFEEFEQSVYREPSGGKYVVNGDTPISDRKQLREFFENNIQKDPPQVRTKGLIVAKQGAQDAVWNTSQKKALSYCVSQTFGDRHSKVVADMQAATGAWEQVADVEFQHVASQDGQCNASNAGVMFDVRPVNVNGEYLARAFFPNEPRADRNVLIDESSFQLSPTETLKLVGILRHELGHALGWRHEHTRTDAGACFEDANWRPVTSYDKFSVMHYPQCNGGGDWSLSLTKFDESGAACVYGPALGFTIDTSVCTGPGPAPTSPCGPKTQTFSSQRVPKGQQRSYGPFTVSPGTRFEAKMSENGSAPGDPDLFVGFGQAPTATTYACRPFLTGAEEECSLDVPANKTKAFVMVRGYKAGAYDLAITFVGQP